METQLRKLADLEIGCKYYVVGYRSINTQYGDSYIVTCKSADEYDDDETEFEMFASKVMTTYISAKQPSTSFPFTVRRNTKCTYTEIFGYNTNSYVRLN